MKFTGRLRTRLPCNFNQHWNGYFWPTLYIHILRMSENFNISFICVCVKKGVYYACVYYLYIFIHVFFSSRMSRHVIIVRAHHSLLLTLLGNSVLTPITESKHAWSVTLPRRCNTYVRVTHGIGPESARMTHRILRSLARADNAVLWKRPRVADRLLEVNWF